MKKFLLITYDFPPRRGGAARYYNGLASELDNLVVFTDVTGEVTPRVIRQPLQWKFWPKWLPLLWHIPLAKFRTQAKVLGAGEVLPIGTVLWLLHIFFNWPYLVFLHGFDLLLTNRNHWKRWLSNRILRGSQLVVCNSQFTKARVLERGIKEGKVQVVYPCTNLVFPATSGIVKKLKERWRLQSKHRIVLSVARLVKRKGIDQVLEAMAELTREIPELVYVVVGDGPERHSLELRAYDLGLKVIFTGEVADEELAAWYDLAEIFILTPHSHQVDVEGFGIVYLEAQAAGKAIIASGVGGIMEAVGDAGIFISSYSELLTAARNLLTNKTERERLGARGKVRVRTNFNWQRQAEILADRLH